MTVEHVPRSTTAPSMKNSPWATLTIRITPNTRDSPSAVSARTKAPTVPSRRARKRCGLEAHERGSAAGAAPAVPAGVRAGLQRLLRIVRLGLVHRVLDRRPVHDLQLALLHPGDDLLAERLVDPTHEALRPLGVLDAFRE